MKTKTHVKAGPYRRSLGTARRDKRPERCSGLLSSETPVENILQAAFTARLRPLQFTRVGARLVRPRDLSHPK